MSITIPPAALEAGARVIREDRRSVYSDEGLARAACLAMLQAWEGAKTVRDDGRRQTYVLPALILPLTETSDEQ